MAEWQQWCQGKLISSQKAVSEIRSGDKVVLSNIGLSANTWGIVDALVQRKGELRGVKVVSTVQFPPGPWLEPGMEESFELLEPFSSRTTWEGIRQGRVQNVPDPFSFRNADRLLEPGRASVCLGADWAVIPVSVPNKGGYMGFGTNPWWNSAAARTARKAIGVVHPDFPWVYGDTIHISELTYLVESVPTPAEYMVTPPPTPEDEARAAGIIGTLASELIRDGDTIEIGMGGPSHNVVNFLTHKNDLGIHSEGVGGDIILDLIKPGIANGSRKNINRGKAVGTMGGAQPTDPRYQEVRDFVEGNPNIEWREISYVNNPVVIASHDNMVAINNVVAIDLRGQVQMDHAGNRVISGLGGQLDFVIGSHYSKGGRSITLLISTAQGGKLSRIWPAFPEGSPVSIPCVYVDYLVTEHGVVNLEGKTPRQRADAIISVAHPNFQPELRQAAKKLFWP